MCVILSSHTSQVHPGPFIPAEITHIWSSFSTSEGSCTKEREEVIRRGKEWNVHVCVKDGRWIATQRRWDSQGGVLGAKRSFVKFHWTGRTHLPEDLLKPGGLNRGIKASLSEHGRMSCWPHRRLWFTWKQWLIYPQQRLWDLFLPASSILNCMHSLPCQILNPRS